MLGEDSYLCKEHRGTWTKLHLTLGAEGKVCWQGMEARVEFPVQFLQHSPILKGVEETVTKQ